MLELGENNAVTYDIAKTKVLFFKFHCQQLIKQIAEMDIKV